jgi:hypothetical protein
MLPTQALERVAFMLAARGFFDEARRLMRRVLQARATRLGELHALVAITMRRTAELELQLAQVRINQPLLCRIR